MKDLIRESDRELESLWDEFLTHWPIERLNSINLYEYTSQGTDDSFCYWLESATEKLGSIWGGSSFKFGIYARKDKSPKESSRGRSYNQDFGWMMKYGKSPEEAYSNVLEQILKVAKAARTGDLQTVQEADLGEAVRWKIAFLYQDREHRILLPIFKFAMLKALTDLSGSINPITAHQELLSKQGSQSYFDFAKNLWEEAAEKLGQKLTANQAQAYFDESPDYQPIKAPTKYIAGYEGPSGKQIALVRQNKNVTLFLTVGDWLDQINSLVTSITTYSSNDSRNSNLAPNAPDLAIGNPIVSLVVESLDTLEKVCAAYEDDIDSIYQVNESEQHKETAMTDALNQILYGPPGTGKTYATTDMAVKIAAPQWYKENSISLDATSFRKAMKNHYDELVNKERIIFTTFHQSFSYEDFIEGIRAETNEDTNKLQYLVKDGVFKRICDNADKKVLRNEGIAELDISNKKIWKMSLGNTQKDESEEIFNECIENDYVLLGWGGNIDFSGCKNIEDVEKRYLHEQPGDENRYAISTVNRFINQIGKGDIIVVSAGNTRYQAIGEVVGDYTYLNDDERAWFFQSRKVRWLKVYEKPRPVGEIYDKIFSQQALYKLNASSLRFNALSELLTDKNTASAPEPYVLIIDEINRGNISRIFGELITLLEPDKRKDGTDERSAVLPYSKTIFQVPQNVYVIGTMNTADRSLAQLDLALRRRFSFIETPPQPELLRGISVHDMDMADLLDTINQRIEVLLDRDHLLGHEYLFPLKDLAREERSSRLGLIFLNNIIPLLQEYFFDDWERIRWVLNDHRKKSLDAQFITEGGNNNLQQLFGNEIQENLSERRFKVNPDALYNPNAYRGILSATDPETK